MSEWKTVQTLVSMGDKWSVSGIGSAYVESVTTFTQTVTLQDTNSAKFWLPGNGTDSYLVLSASITQSGKSAPVKVNGKTSFYVPKDGRWSDWVSIADFALPGDVVFSFAIANTSPQKIPTAISAPTTPVGVSGYQVVTSFSDYVGTVLGFPIVDKFNSFALWTTKAGQHIVFPAGSLRYVKDNTGRIPVMPDIFCISLDITFDDLGTAASGDTVLLTLYWLTNYLIILLNTDGIVINSTNKAAEIVATDIPLTVHFLVDATDPLNAVLKTYVDDGTTLTLHSTINLNLYFTPTSIDHTYLTLGGNADSTKQLATVREMVIYSEAPSFLNGTEAFSEVTSTCTITVTTNPDPGDTLTINNSATTVFAFVDHYPNNSGEIQIGATTAITAANIATAISNITGAEFAATSTDNIITVVAHVSTPFSVTTTSDGLTIGTITEVVPGLIDEEASASDTMTATEGGKAVQEAASVADNIDGLIDGLSENVSASASIDCLMDSVEGSVNCTASADFDGLIEYMGEETT